MRTEYECVGIGTSKAQTSTVDDQSMGSSCPPLSTAAFEFPADENTDGWLGVGHLMGNMIQCIPWTHFTNID